MVSPTPRKSSEKSKTMSYVQVILKQGSRKHEHFYYQKPQKVFLTVLPGCKPFQRV